METLCNSSPLFMHYMHLNFPGFIAIIIMKVILQHTLYHGNLPRWSLGRGTIRISHFRALRSTTSHFPACLFLSIMDDIHIIVPPSIVSFTYEHLKIKLHAIGPSIQPHKCVAWSPYGLLLDFNTPSQFTTP